MKIICMNVIYDLELFNKYICEINVQQQYLNFFVLITIDFTLKIYLRNVYNHIHVDIIGVTSCVMEFLNSTEHFINKFIQDLRNYIKK